MSQPTFGDMEGTVTFGDMEGPSEPAGAPQGLIPEDRSGVSLPGPGEALEVQDNPAYQNQQPFTPPETLELAPQPTGGPRDGLAEVLYPLLVDALARIAPDEGIVFALSLAVAQLPDGQSRMLPLLSVEVPSPVVGYVLSHSLHFTQMSQWTQAEMDDVVRNVVEVIHTQRAQALGAVPAQNGGRPSGLILPGR